MRWSARDLVLYLVVVLVIAALGWSVAFQPVPRADFAFCNGTEIKTVDPAIVSGAPEGRVIQALFEGLLGIDPKTAEPTTEFGTAERYTVSDDGLTYTFHLRDEACWSNGDPVTAEDFRWSMMRVLHPETAAEYAYELYYIQGAETFNTAEVNAGDRVEVELSTRPDPRQLFPRGEIVRGKLISVANQGTESAPRKIYTVEIDGKRRRFSSEVVEDGIEACHWVLPDFDETVAIRALDAHTLQIKLEHPTHYFPKLMAFYPFFPVNRKCVEKHGYPEFTKPENLVNNGAFRLEFRRVRDRIRLRKSETYWNRDAVGLETIDVLSVSSEHTGLNLYLSGEADWINTVPTTMIKVLREKYADREYKDFDPQPYLATYFYRVNVREGPLADVRVRQALNMAIDKRRIVDDIVKAKELPARSFVPPGIPDYEPAYCGPYDPQRAQELLAEAGYPGGQNFPTIEILYNTSEAHRAIAEFIQAEWKKTLGVNIRLVNLEWGSFLAMTRQGEYYVARAGWIGDYSDPNTFLKMFVTGGANNQTGWGNERYDRIINELATREVDSERRLALLQEAEGILMQEQPIIPLYYYSSKNMVRPYVKNFYHNIQDLHPLYTIGIDHEEKERVLEREGWR